jgi:hypothetical protein
MHRVGFVWVGSKHPEEAAEAECAVWLAEGDHQRAGSLQRLTLTLSKDHTGSDEVDSTRLFDATVG